MKKNKKYECSIQILITLQELIIFKIIDKLLEEGIENISITVGYKKEILQEIITEQYKNQCELNFIPTDYNKPPGNSIKTSIENFKKIFKNILNQKFDYFVNLTGYVNKSNFLKFKIEDQLKSLKVIIF